MAAHPHDALFRALTQDARRADQLVRGYLPPEVGALLSGEPARLLADTFVSGWLRTTQADRLLAMRLKDGRPAFIYVLLEHKSTVDAGTPLQLLGYMVEVWKRYASESGSRSLPPIIPLVFYHGEGRWTVPVSVLDMVEAPAALAGFVRSLSYIVHDLGEVEFQRLSPDPGVRAVLGLLKHGSRRVLPPETGRRILVDIESLAAGDVLLGPALAYLAAVFEVRREELDGLFPAGGTRIRRYLMATLAEHWAAEGEARGRAKGRAEGEAKGRAEGKAETLLRLLGRRFGAVPEAVTARVRTAPVTDLDRWLDALLDARELDEVFEDRSMH